MEEETMESQSVVQAPVAVEDRKVNPPTIAILLIVILLAGIGGVYAGIQIGKKQAGGGTLTKITPTTIPQPTQIPTTPDETANWKTYNNESVGITFRVPSSWLEREDPPKGTPIFEDPNGKMWVDVYYFGSIGGISGIMTLDNYCSSQHKYGSGLIKYNIKISNLPAVYCVNEDNKDSNLPSVLFMIQKDNIQYELSAGFGKESFRNNLNLFLQILSTFKFLD